MSRSENRQSVSGIGGKVCVHGIWDCESTSVWGQQGDLVDRETVLKVEGPSFITASAGVILFRYDIVIIPAC